jgi:hypothetical protein
MRKSVGQAPTAGEQTQQKPCRTSSDIGAEQENSYRRTRFDVGSEKVNLVTGLSSKPFSPPPSFISSSSFAVQIIGLLIAVGHCGLTFSTKLRMHSPFHYYKIILSVIVENIISFLLSRRHFPRLWFYRH